MDPVKVTPPTADYELHKTDFYPIRTPRYAVTRWNTVRWSTSASTLPMLVNTAARPTTECNSTTICGSPVTVMRRSRSAPMRYPMPANWVRASEKNPRARKYSPC